MQREIVLFSKDIFRYATLPIEIAGQLATNSFRGRPYRGSLGSAVDFYLRRAKELHNHGGPTPMLLPDWNSIPTAVKVGSGR